MERAGGDVEYVLVKSSGIGCFTKPSGFKKGHSTHVMNILPDRCAVSEKWHLINMPLNTSPLRHIIQSFMNWCMYWVQAMNKVDSTGTSDIVSTLTNHNHYNLSRDKYVTMNWKNIRPVARRQFFRIPQPGEKEHSCQPLNEDLKPHQLDKCQSTSKPFTMGLPYDFESVMHYPLIIDQEWVRMVCNCSLFFSKLITFQDVCREREWADHDLEQKILSIQPRSVANNDMEGHSTKFDFADLVGGWKLSDLDIKKLNIAYDCN